MQTFVNGYGLEIKRKNEKTILTVDFGHLCFGVASMALSVPMETSSILCEYGPFSSFFPAKMEVYATEQIDGTMALSHQMPVAMRFLRLTLPEKLNRNNIMCIAFESREHPGAAKSNFFCDDEILNRIWETGARTIHLCRVQNAYSYAFRRPEMEKHIHYAENWRGEGENFVLVDGPRRDKEVWVGDLLPEIRSCLTVFGDAETARNSLQLFADKQHADGFVPASSVSSQDFLEYCCWYCVCVYEYYLLTADRAFVEKLCVSIENVIRYITEKRDENGLISLAQMQTWAWTLRRSGKITSSNCVQVMALAAAGAMFHLLGKEEQAQNAQQMAVHTTRSLCHMAYNGRCEAFCDTVDGDGKTFSLDGGALAVLSEVAQGKTAQSTLAYLLHHHKGSFGFYNIFPKEKETASNYPHNLEIWPFANNFLLDALFEQGYDKEAFSLLKDCWGTMAVQSETFWEIIDHKTGKFMNRPLFENGTDMDRYNSECHGWSAGVNYTLMRYIAGIRLERPGYEVFVFQPHPCGIRKLTAELATSMGTIKVFYEKVKPAEYRAVLQLPEGVTCLFGGETLKSGVHSITFKV